MRTPKTMTALLAAMSLFIATNARSEGTAGGGGGHNVQDTVRTRIVELFNSAKKMTPAQKAILKFNPVQVLGVLNRPPEGFKVLCATGETLENIRREGKMARVYEDNTMIINLNCKDYSLATWKALASSNKDEDAEFFIHEGLRVALQVNEDGELYSSSYIDALMADPDYENVVKTQAINSFFSGTNPDCRLEFKTKRYSKVYNEEGNFDGLWGKRKYLVFNVRGQTVTEMFLHEYELGSGYHAPSDDFVRTTLLAKISSKDGDDAAFMNRVYELSQTLGCGQ